MHVTIDGGLNCPNSLSYDQRRRCLCIAECPMDGEGLIAG